MVPLQGFGALSDAHTELWHDAHKGLHYAGDDAHKGLQHEEGDAHKGPYYGLGGSRMPSTVSQSGPGVTRQPRSRDRAASSAASCGV